MGLPFDTIVVNEGDEQKRMNVTQFLALDLATRVRLVMSGSIGFFSGEQGIPQGEALSALQKYSASGARS